MTNNLCTRNLEIVGFVEGVPTLVQDEQGALADEPLVRMHARGNKVNADKAEEKAQKTDEGKKDELPVGDGNLPGAEGALPEQPKGRQEKDQARPNGPGKARLGQE